MLTFAIFNINELKSIMKKAFFAIGIAVILAGCYPKGPTYVSDLDLVATDYEKGFDFGSQTEFFVFDTIVHIIGEAQNDNISRNYDKRIIKDVRDNMLARGYEEVNTPQQADLVLNISAWTNTTVNYYYGWYDYWGWGYPGYGPAWGWGYPVGGYTYVNSYTFGTILIEMNYPEGANIEEHTIPVVWTGLINGMLSNSSSDNVTSRIDDTIDQTFEQSPYIQKN